MRTNILYSDIRYYIHIGLKTSIMLFDRFRIGTVFIK